MAEIMYLDELPDCEACKDPTKRRDGELFDVPEPGEITPIYGCDNEPCKRKRNEIEAYILRWCRAESEKRTAKMP